jgi:hypothetical protein
VILNARCGAVKREPIGGRAFPYKEKEFMLQFQAWWSDPEDPTPRIILTGLNRFASRSRGTSKALLSISRISCSFLIRMILLSYRERKALQEIKKLPKR